jgi:TolB-like protein/Tfp pilus assembly protein PilF
MSDDTGKPGLFEELKRRSVFRAAALYAVVAWLLIQIGEATFEPLGLPDGSQRLLIILLGLGFPVAVVLAWIFDLTPQGIVRTSDEGTPDVRRRIDLAIIAGLLLVIGLLLWGPERTSLPQEEARPAGTAAFENPPLPDKPSLVVLPFEDLGGPGEADYLAAGLVHELTRALATVPELFVIASDSARDAKARGISVREVGEQLGVEYVLRGSVRAGEERARITTELLVADSGRLLWSESYDRAPSAEILDLQSEIAETILGKLRIELRERELDRLAPGTQDVTAYELYLRASQIPRSALGEEGLEAERLLTRAVELDPDYADALARLAEVRMARSMVVQGRGPKRLEDIASLAHRAQELDPGNVAAEMVLGLVAYGRGDLEAFRAAAARAVELAPSEATAHWSLASANASLGKLDLALQSARRARRLNPAEAGLIAFEGSIQHRRGHTEEAIRLLERARSVAGSVATRIDLVDIYETRGQHEQAQRIAREIRELNPELTAEGAVRLMEALPALGRLMEGRQAQLRARLAAAGIPDRPQPAATDGSDRPSLIALPFDNLSGDPEQDYFAEAISVDLTTGLSRSLDLRVLSPSAALALQGEDPSPQWLHEELGVRYVVGGSVRRGDTRLRLNVTLTDASTGSLVWSESYDRELQELVDLLELQTQIVRTVLGRLNVQVREAEHTRPTESLTAYDAFIKARGLIRQAPARPELIPEARRLFQLATELDPEFGDAHALLGGTYVAADVVHGVPDEARLAQAEAAVDRALAVDPNSTEAHSVMAAVVSRRGALRAELEHLETAIELSPSYDSAFMHKAIFHLRLREWEPAREALETVLELHPRFPHPYFWFNLGCAHYYLGQSEQGLAQIERARRAGFSSATRWLIDHYENAGRREESSRLVQALRQEQPELTAEMASAALLQGSACPPEHPDRVLANLRKAGLP